jgi:hypothetical protein
MEKNMKNPVFYSNNSDSKYNLNEKVKNNFKKYKNEIILLLIWIISIFIVNPLGDFPLNDDWAYGLDVFHLSQEGKLILNDWPAMTLIAQVLWGSLVTFIFGFSFTVLRISSLFIGLFSVWIFYKILIFSGISKKISMGGALLLMFTPLFFNAAFTFMTEVYFLFSLNLSILYFLKFFKSEQNKDLVLGTLFVLITTLIRQPGIILGFAFTFVFLLNKKIGKRHLIIALIPTIVSLIGYLGYTVWLKYNFSMPNYRGMGSLVSHLIKTPLSFYLNQFILTVMYLGLFSLPITFLLLPKIIINYKWYEKLIIIVLFVIPLSLGLFKGFPCGNIIYNLGLGPKLLKDGFWGNNIHPMIPEWGMRIIRLISLFSAAVVFTHFIKKPLKSTSRIYKISCSPARFSRALCITFFFLYFTFILLNLTFFDRYTLPLIPSIFLILLPLNFNYLRNRLIFITTIAFYAVFCITATHDYVSWNRARWKAIDQLTNKMKIEKTKIDGGFEFNSWFQTGSLKPVNKNKISWWFVFSDDYMLSFGNIKGFEKIGKTEYKRLLVSGIDSICILQKNANTLKTNFSTQCDCEVINGRSNNFLSKNRNIEFLGGNQLSSHEAHSGIYSIRLNKKEPYGLLSKYNNVMVGDQFIVSVWRKSSDDKAGLVISSEPNNKFYFFNNKSVESNKEGWCKIVSRVIVPKDCDEHTIKIYLWNTGNNKAWFDDLEIIKNR